MKRNVVLLWKTDISLICAELKFEIKTWRGIVECKNMCLHTHLDLVGDIRVKGPKGQ